MNMKLPAKLMNERKKDHQYKEQERMEEIGNSGTIIFRQFLTRTRQNQKLIMRNVKVQETRNEQKIVQHNKELKCTNKLFRTKRA